MKKVMSFCLFGDNPLYTEGAIQNVIIAKKLYQDWQCYFYVDQNTEQATIDTLSRLGARISLVNESYHTATENLAKKMYWRFYALDEPDVERVIFRDCDSRISEKERYAVEEWIRSEKDFHFMYDHKWHSTHIMGGMWGVKSGLIKNIKAEIEDFFNLNKDNITNYSLISDQAFLKEVLWSKYVSNDNYLAHGNYEMCEYHIKNLIQISPYPISTNFSSQEQHFIGQVVMVPGAKTKPNKLTLN